MRHPTNSRNYAVAPAARQATVCGGAHLRYLGGQATPAVSVTEVTSTTAMNASRPSPLRRGGRRAAVRPLRAGDIPAVLELERAIVSAGEGVIHTERDLRAEAAL